MKIRPSLVITFLVNFFSQLNIFVQKIIDHFHSAPVDSNSWAKKKDWHESEEDDDGGWSEDRNKGQTHNNAGVTRIPGPTVRGW